MNTFSCTYADCPICEKQVPYHELGAQCKLCLGTYRDPIPWTELFVAGRSFDNCYTGKWKW